MSNHYFQFKEFRIDQRLCAMKVTTDACIQGAWTPVLPAVNHVLDIGTGTGLLSLMLAQRNNKVNIHAIEIDEAAAQQAIANAGNSPWKDRINVIHADVRTHQFPCKYDLIITNPPFFNDSLLGPKEQKNFAKHTISLSYQELLEVIGENLSEGGYVSTLLPTPEYKTWMELCLTKGWQEVGKLRIKHTENAPVKRIVSIISRVAKSYTEETLVIMNEDNTYTESFTKLLQPFYLAL